MMSRMTRQDRVQRPSEIVANQVNVEGRTMTTLYENVITATTQNRHCGCGSGTDSHSNWQMRVRSGYGREDALQEYKVTSICSYVPRLQETTGRSR